MLLRATGNHWTDPSADGDSPVAVRARVGPAMRRRAELTGTNSLDVASTPGEDAQLMLWLQSAPTAALQAADQEAS